MCVLNELIWLIEFQLTLLYHIFAFTHAMMQWFSHFSHVNDVKKFIDALNINASTSAVTSVITFFHYCSLHVWLHPFNSPMYSTCCYFRKLAKSLTFNESVWVGFVHENENVCMNSHHCHPDLIYSWIGNWLGRLARNCVSFACAHLNCLFHI